MITDRGPPPIIETRAGRIRGVNKDNYLVFKGIPYGADSSGANRFLPPKPVAAWTGVRDATRYGPAAPQSPLPSSMTVEQARNFPLMRHMPIYGMTALHADQSEDCLVLNIWTPAADGKRRPVMFRIHGGGYAIGAGDWVWHDGANIARRGDLVVVTVNHRLNIMGYMHLEELGGAQYAGSGNAGMLDLVQALEWVRDNIAAFGGDPGNVTIFGESGGGCKVGGLLAMPAAKGLFHKAIMESGTPRMLTRDAAGALTCKVLAQLEIGPGELDKLAELPLPKIYEAQFAAGIRGVAGFAPVLDGAVCPREPFEAYAAGASAEVPLLIGSNLTEGVMFAEPNLDAVFGMDEAELKKRVETIAPGRAQEVISHYRRGMPQAGNGPLYFAIDAGSSFFRRGGVLAAEAKLKGASAPVYMYLLAWLSQGNNGRALASHGIEVPLTMDNVQTSGTWVADDPNAQAMADQMSEAWIAFARSGNPSHSGIENWTPFTLPARATMVFDLRSKMQNDPYGEAALWNWSQTPERLLAV